MKLGVTKTNLRNGCLDFLSFSGIIADALGDVRVDDDECHRHFATVVIRNWDYASVRDVRVVEKAAFKLGWCDLESPNFHNFLFDVYQGVRLTDAS